MELYISNTPQAGSSGPVRGCARASGTPADTRRSMHADGYRTGGCRVTQCGFWSTT